MTSVHFKDLGLAEPILHALIAEKHETPTPIQAQAIPEVMAGRDLLGLAQTGTGKTAAFTLPILHRLIDMPRQLTPKTAHVLILAPTRELAVQIGERTQAYGKNLRLKQAIILGGVSQYRQVQALARGVDLLIATPGRLLDLINQRHLRLDQTSILILDEADRMFDMGFIHKVRQIVSMMPQQRQTLLFSATMPPDISKLAQEILRDPVRIEVASTQVTADRIEQTLHYVDTKNKKDLLIELLTTKEDMKRVIVFTRTKHAADRITEHLQKADIATDAIHGDKSQNARQRSLENFRSGRVRVLVATDIAARGIDVSNITHVVNLELPNEAESYVHRIGRTARAGTEGQAISFCDSSERNFLRDIERVTKQRLTVVSGDPQQLIYMEPAGKGGGGRRGGGQGQSRPQYQRNDGGAPRRPRQDGEGQYRSEGRSEGRSEARPESRGSYRPDTRGDTRSDNRGDNRFQGGGRPEGRPMSQGRPEGRPMGQARPEGRFEGRSEGRSEGRRDARPDSRPDRQDSRPAHQGGFRGDRSESRGNGAPGGQRDSRGGNNRRPQEQGQSARRDGQSAPRRRQNQAA